MLFAATVDSTLYRLVLFGHIIFLVAAFSPMIVHPLMTKRLQKRGDGSVRSFLTEAAPLGRQVYGMSLVAAGLFGIVLVLLGDPWEFSQTWVSVAFVLWIGLMGVLYGMLLPAERAWAAGEEDAATKVERSGMIMTLLFLAMVADMIFKPGF